MGRLMADEKLMFKKGCRFVVSKSGAGGVGSRTRSWR
jgi:hypothetical protein